MADVPGGAAVANGRNGTDIKSADGELSEGDIESGDSDVDMKQVKNALKPAVASAPAPTLSDHDDDDIDVCVRVQERRCFTHTRLYPAVY